MGYMSRKRASRKRASRKRALRKTRRKTRIYKGGGTSSATTTVSVPVQSGSSNETFSL